MTLLDYARAELRAKPLTLREVLVFLVGFAAVLLGVVLGLSTGPVPA